jgi:hypothetical protein
MHELCDHPDHPAYWEAWEGGYGPGQIKTGDPRAVRKPDPACVHRGDIMGTADCGCAGKPKVYQCGIHGFCMDRKLKPGRVPVVMEHSKQSVDMRYCNACDDFATKEIPPPSKPQRIIAPPVTDAAVEPQASDLALVVTFPKLKEKLEYLI